ncbi:MAG: glutathione S-transferase family protein [Caldimonas sp.]|nr:glutathione S-transferase family protein [Pseudomonadota bacterium]
MQLYIGNKNYSSWSLRPWLLMTQASIAFEEKQLRLSWDDSSVFKKTLLALAPSGRVPLLVDDGFAVWDSLAIAEYLAERFAEKRLWPVAARARARARSLCAEMHSGFAALRSTFGMNIEASLPEVGQRMLRENADAARDLKRIDAMWLEALEASGGPFLFGEFSIADAFFAPVCSRVHTFALPLAKPAQEYADRVLSLPAFREWEKSALAEHDFLVEDEPYRKR